MIIKYLLILSLIVMACESERHNSNTEIIVCGWDEVFIVDSHKSSITDGLPQKIWSWSAKERVDLPNDYKNLFNTTDECKPFDQGNKILITSSGGGVALVDREKDQVLFYAKATNAHSADLLPNNRIAVAASYSSDGSGDRLILFDLDKPGQEILSKPLYGGHGVVWDNQRQVLWALSGNDIVIFKPEHWDTTTPDLLKVSTIALPDSDGHDLYPISDSPYLSVSTGLHCWYFDRDSYEFTPHPILANEKKVKSISQHPQTRQVVYVQAEGENWWAERIHFPGKKQLLYQPNERFYKVRWNIRVQ